MTAIDNNTFKIVNAQGWEYNSHLHGIYVVNKTIPPLPAMTDYTEKILGQDGSHSFATEFENREITIEILVRAATIQERIEKVRDLAKVLNPKRGFQQLIFGDDPEIYYLVKLNAAPDQSFAESVRNAQITLTFNAAPYAYKLGTSAVFKGNSDNIEMSIATKSDTDVPFRLEITGDVENSKPNEFWDLKDDSKNIIPNPRQQQDATGDTLKWNVSGEYSNKDEFFKQYGFTETFEVYTDTITDFCSKIKNGTIVAKKFTVRVSYAADGSGYLVRTYHYLINGFEVKTTTETEYATVWTGAAEYNASKIVTDANAVFQTLLGNKIISPAWTTYIVHQNITMDTGYLMGGSTTTFFQTSVIEKSFDIVSDTLILYDLKAKITSGNVVMQEFGLKRGINSVAVTTDLLINNVLVFRRYYKLAEITYANSPWDYALTSNSWSTNYAPALTHFGLTFASTSNVNLNQYSLLYTGKIVIPLGGTTVKNSKIINPPEYKHFWPITSGVIQDKDVRTIPAANITSLIVRWESYEIFGGSIYRYVYTVHIKTANGTTCVHQVIGGDVSAAVQTACGLYGLTYTGVTYPTPTAGSGGVFLAPEAYEYVVSGGALQTPSTKITDIAVVEGIPSLSDTFFTPTQALPIPTETIIVSFAEDIWQSIPFNAAVCTKLPFVHTQNRYRYLYSDILSIATASSYVLSAYAKGAAGRIGLLILNNDQQYIRRVTKDYIPTVDYTRSFITEALGENDKKVILYVEYENQPRISDEYTSNIGLFQLETAPLSDFSENGTLYAIVARIRRNLLDNAGLKFAEDGRCDRWGQVDSSVGRITSEYTASDLPFNIDNQAIGYGAANFTTVDVSADSYNRYLYQAVNVKPLTSYTFSLYGKKTTTRDDIKGKIMLVEKNSSGGIIKATEKYLNLDATWKPYSMTLMTLDATVTVEVQAVVEKSGTVGSGTVTIKYAALQLEASVIASIWEDDLWDSDYQKVSRNIVYNPAYGVASGSNVPDGWSYKTNSPSGVCNSTISVVSEDVLGVTTNIAKITPHQEASGVGSWLESRAFSVKEARYYAASIYIRASMYVGNMDYIANKIWAEMDFVDSNGVIIQSVNLNVNYNNSSTVWGRYTLKGTQHAMAPVGAVTAHLRVGIKDMYYEPVAGSAFEFAMVQVEEVSAYDSLITPWEDNYTFTIKVPETPKTIKPVYIKNPRIYKSDGSLFFSLDTTILNTEKIVYDTEKLQAYILKANGSKANILDDVYVYIYNPLAYQLTEQDRFYLRYSDESGIDENTNEKVQVTVKIDWTAKTL